jgi:hypothetical protein
MVFFNLFLQVLFQTHHFPELLLFGGFGDWFVGFGDFFLVEEGGCRIT